MKHLTTLAIAATLLIGAMQAPALAETMIITDKSGKEKLVTIPDEKNPWLSGVSSAIITGTGQMWNGEWGKGLLFMGGAVGLGMIMSGGDVTRRNNPEVIIPVLALQVYSIFDAASTANKMNDERQKILNFHINDVPTVSAPAAPEPDTDQEVNVTAPVAP